MNESTKNGMQKTEELDIRKRIEPLVERLDRLMAPVERESVDILLHMLMSDEMASIPLLEEALATLKAQREAILADDIPCLLAEYGMSEAVMLDGTKIGTEMYYSTSTADRDKALLASWLGENGYGDVIKDTIELGKGEFDERISTFLQSNGYTYKKDSSVHPQTLKSVIRKHIEAGGDMPPTEAIEVKMYQRARIVPPKEPKAF